MGRQPINSKPRHGQGGASQGDAMTWTSYLEPHLDRLFRTALLLVADSGRAELVFIEVINHFDFTEPPTDDAINLLERDIVLYGVQCSRRRSLAPTERTRALIQPAFWPVLRLPSDQRVCFVVIVILSYRLSSAASLLQTNECTLARRLGSAILALHCSGSVLTNPIDEQTTHSKE